MQRFLIAMWMCAVASLALAQQAPPPPQEQDVRADIRRRVELVVVPVTVKDGRGRLVAGIRREEFRIFEDGEEQEIALFSAEAFPLSVVLLVDNELPRSAAEKVEATLSTIAAGLGPEDEATLMLFDQFPSEAEPFSANNDEWFEKLKRVKLNQTFPGMGSVAMTGGPRVNAQSQATGVPQQVGREPRKNKNLYDAVWAAGMLLRGKPRERRKIIFLISDGRNSRDNQYDYEQTLQLLLASDVSVYAVSVDERAVRTGGDLRRFAEATGGDVYLGRSRENLETLYAQLTEQARHQYTLGYVPRGRDASREYHDIEVRVRRSGLQLIARDGYFLAAP
jgi:VWFA-related protein